MFGPLKNPLNTECPFQDLGSVVGNLGHSYDKALLVIGEYCIAVFKDYDGNFGFFDPHSRNVEGLVNPDGTAVMLTFANVENLVSQLYTMCNSLGFNDCTQYELMFVTILHRLLSVETETNSSSERNMQEYINKRPKHRR